MRQVRLDAADRAWRTFWAGLGIDVAIALSTAITLSLADSDLAWSATYWAGLGALLVKTALSSAASYVLRYWIPPGG